MQGNAGLSLGETHPNLRGLGVLPIFPKIQSWKCESPQPVTCSPLGHPRHTLHLPWSGSLSSYDYVESRPKRAPTMAPQLQPDLLNITFGANFNPCPESG